MNRFVSYITRRHFSDSTGLMSETVFYFECSARRRETLRLLLANFSVTKKNKIIIHSRCQEFFSNARAKVFKNLNRVYRLYRKLPSRQVKMLTFIFTYIILYTVSNHDLFVIKCNVKTWITLVPFQKPLHFNIMNAKIGSCDGYTNPP